MTYSAGLRAHVDKDVCISSGKCVADAPQAFDFDDDEIAEAIDGHPGLSDDGLVEVARTCPSGAIHVHDADGVEIEVF
jgi:ferredoxin